MINNKHLAALVCVCLLLLCAPNGTNADSTNVQIVCCNGVVDSFYRDIKSENGLSDLIGEIRWRDGGNGCDNDVSFTISGIDVDCDGVPDRVKGGFTHYERGHETALLDEKGNVKNTIRDYNNRGIFLGVIPLPFDPANDSNYTCAKRILDLFGHNFPVRQNGADQIKYLIKNSINGRKGRIPSGWMTGFDTTFQSYSCVFSSSVLSEMGIDKTAWARAYMPLGDIYGWVCDNPYNKDCPADSLFENAKGFIFYYLAHNHLRKKHEPFRDSQGNLKYDTSITKTKIPISKDLALYQTGHGVLLQKGNLYRWIYHEDQVERLRWYTIKKVTVSKSGKITVFRTDANGNQFEYSDEEYENAEWDRMPEPKPLTFRLKDFL